MDFKPFFHRFCTVALVVAASALPAAAQSPRRGGPGTGNPDIQLVPWRFLQSDTLVHEAPVTIYWIPTSVDDTEHHPLTSSKALLSTATRCVAFEIVPPERASAVRKLAGVGKAPAAFLVDGNGNVVRRLDSDGNGLLATDKVERMLNEELSVRDETMYRQMIAANQLGTSGHNKEAIELYQKIWDDRCLYPRAGADAQRALKELGVTVTEKPSPLAPPLPKTETSH
jgi:hypothetical protein